MQINFNYTIPAKRLEPLWVKRKAPIYNSTLTVANQSLKLGSPQIGQKMIAYSIEAPNQFTYKNNTYNSNDWVVKIFNPSKTPNKLVYLNTLKTVNYLKESNICYPEILIAPWNYEHETDGCFWIVKKVYMVSDQESLSKFVPFVHSLFKLNESNDGSCLLHITPENIGFDEEGTPYFTSLSATKDSKIEMLLRDINKFNFKSENLLAITASLNEETKDKLQEAILRKRIASEVASELDS